MDGRFSRETMGFPKSGKRLLWNTWNDGVIPTAMSEILRLCAEFQKPRRGFIVSQPFIEGPYPVKSVIVEEFRRYGFVLVPGFSIGSESDSSFYNHTLRLGIFDATCDNFILSQQMPIPVDVIVIPVGDRLRGQLLAMISQ